MTAESFSKRRKRFCKKNTIQVGLHLIKCLYFQLNGCITFEHLKTTSQTQADYVMINEDGDRNCFNELGRLGGEQILNLDKDCLRNQTIVHKLLRTLGILCEI